MLRRVLWWILTDLSEELTASVRAVIDLMTGIEKSSETSANTRLHGATSQKTAFFILVSVKIRILTFSTFLIQGYFRDGTRRNTVPKVVSQKR
jgi:hypothetical protein